MSVCVYTVFSQCPHTHSAQVAPFITTGNTGLVHHMLLYVCPASTLVTSPGHCDDLPMEAVGCRGGQILGSWAIGGTVCLVLACLSVCSHV